MTSTVRLSPLWNRVAATRGSALSRKPIGRGGVLLDRVEDRKVGGSLPDRIIRRIVADQPVELAFDESGVELGFDEIVFQQGVGEEGGVGLHRPDLDAFGDIGQGLDRVRPGLFPHDELGDHGIVMR